MTLRDEYETMDTFTAVSHVVYPLGAAGDDFALYVESNSDGVDVIDRRRLRIEPGGHASLATYFNSFPAAHWRRVTRVSAVRLSANLVGGGILTVWGATAGDARIVHRQEFSDGGLRLDLPVVGPSAADVYWIAVDGGDAGAELRDARWETAVPADWQPGRATIGVATFNRPEYCVAVLDAIGASPELQEVLDAVVVVDQGSLQVKDRPEYAAAVAPLGDRMTLVTQPNLGGSGGFARAMLIGSERSDHVILLDDDVRIEPESLFRAVRFADFAREPTIVGGGMLHLDAEAVLYTQGESWDRTLSWIRPPRGQSYDHDFSVAQPEAVDPRLLTESEIDFNGWWMCLIPSSVIQKIGLPLPLFVKFDDVEFGLRAEEYGVPTVSVPGIAVWHMAWHNKDTPRSWEGYFVQRNRVITALLHSHVRGGGLLPLHSLLGDLRLLLKLQYSAVRIRNDAVRDVLRGPQTLPAMLERRRGEVVAVREEYLDAQLIDGAERAIEQRIGPPSKALAPARLLTTLLHHLLRPVRLPAPDHWPVLGAREVDWWTFRLADAAIIRSEDSGTAFRVVRNRRMTWRLLRESVGLYWSLALKWRGLESRYRAAAPDLASRSRWRRVFEEQNIDSNP